ncbi:MAG: transglutaminase domain-containing protein [Lachnospiraceae bacterium]|nr:transglutaminase domain-containing protein [Lachnospiraceae bacterium]
MEKNLYRIVCSLLLVTICLLGAGERIGIDLVAAYHILLALLAVTGITLFCDMKTKGKVLVLISLLTGVLMMLWVVEPEKGEYFWHSYFAGILRNSSVELEWGVGQECIQVLVLSFLCFGVQILTEKLFTGRLFLAGGLLVLLLTDLLVWHSFAHMAVVCVLLYVTIIYVEWTQRGWNKHKGERKRLYMVWLMPFLLLYFILLALTPAPDTPYDWKFVKDAYSWLKETFLTISQEIEAGDREDFEIAMSGFSEDGKLLGGIRENNQEIMRIRGQKSLKTNVYLVGKVYDDFTGKQWLATNESIVEDRRLDALETAYAICMYEEEGLANYMHSTRLNIHYQYFNTGYLFAPLKTWGVEGELAYSSMGGNLQFARKQGYATDYEVNFFQINVDHPLFYQFLDASKKQDEEVWRRVQREYLRDTQKRFAFDELAEHREEIHRIYGQSPVLSEGVTEYLKEIIGEAQSDVEKLKAIEAALAAHTYTMTPGALPEEIDSETEFLDYFLLESKQGFCSYFASAFVLLARAEGIPMRYVEGFCVPVEGEVEVSVYANMAHAWPEAYIDGVGWIPFEPTPGYERIRYTPWEIVEHKNADNSNMGMSWEVEQEEEMEVVKDTLTEEENNLFRQDSKIVRFVLGTLLITIIILILAGVVDTYMGRRRYKRWTLEQRVQHALQRNLQLLGLLGYRKMETETLEELEGRAWAVMRYEQQKEERKLCFLRYYEDMMYGEYQASEEMYGVILEEYKYLMQMLKKWKRFWYIYCKIIYRY